MMTNNRLSIIIVNWNTREFIAECLKSVYATVKMPFEVIVVDNNSSDGSVEFIRDQFPQVTVLEEKENLGFSKANNAAFRHSSGEYLLFLNPDTVLLPSCADMMVHRLNEDRGIGMIGPKIRDERGNIFDVTKGHLPNLPQDILNIFLINKVLRWVKARLSRHAFFARLFYSYHEKTGYCEFLSGSCLMLRREFFGALGGFSEEFPMYLDDIDICYKSLKAGKKNLYLSEAGIIHVRQASVKKSPNYKLHGVLSMQSELFYYKKYFGMKAVLPYKLIVLLSIPYLLLLDIITLPYFFLACRLEERMWAFKNHLRYMDLIMDRPIEGILE